MIERAEPTRGRVVPPRRNSLSRPTKPVRVGCFGHAHRSVRLDQRRCAIDGRPSLEPHPRLQLRGMDTALSALDQNALGLHEEGRARMRNEPVWQRRRTWLGADRDKVSLVRELEPEAGDRDCRASPVDRFNRNAPISEFRVVRSESVRYLNLHLGLGRSGEIDRCPNPSDYAHDSNDSPSCTRIHQRILARDPSNAPTSKAWRCTGTQDGLTCNRLGRTSWRPTTSRSRRWRG